MTDLSVFNANMPKVELHLHLEGTTCNQRIDRTELLAIETLNLSSIASIMDLERVSQN